MLVAAAIAFECPRTEKTGPGVLQETKRDEQAQALSQMLASGNVEDAIGVYVNDLQKRYPQASDTELVNYLVGAYCPVVASMSDLSDAQKTGCVEHFAATAFLFRLMAIASEKVVSPSALTKDPRS